MVEAWLEAMGQAIRQRHDCEVVDYLGTVAVHERDDGETLWQGTVHVFRVSHANAIRAYAWFGEIDHGEAKTVTVLGVPPIKSPADAVRSVVAGGQHDR